MRCTAAYDERLGKPQFLDRPGLYKEATFREGFALLEAHGLSFDAWCFSAQLGDVLDLALAFPGTTIVLNHCGTPVGGLGPHSGVAEYEGKEEEIMAEWRANMARIAAECPNVCVKVGAGGFPHVGAGFNKREKAPTSEEVAETFKSVYLYVIETFGCDRCMFEGTFPWTRFPCPTPFSGTPSSESPPTFPPRTELSCSRHSEARLSAGVVATLSGS